MSRPLSLWKVTGFLPHVKIAVIEWWSRERTLQLFQHMSTCSHEKFNFALKPWSRASVICAAWPRIPFTATILSNHTSSFIFILFSSSSSSSSSSYLSWSATACSKPCSFLVQWECVLQPSKVFVSTYPSLWVQPFRVKLPKHVLHLCEPGENSKCTLYVH